MRIFFMEFFSKKKVFFMDLLSVLVCLKLKKIKKIINLVAYY